MSGRAESLCYSGLRTGMADAVLAEVADCLARLAAAGSESVIDLRSLPLTDADLSELEAALGRGEVHARLEVAGPTEIWETAYAGAWWIRHLGAGGRVAAEQIAITTLPEILKTHPQDVTQAAQRLAADLCAAETGEIEEETSHD